MTGNLELTTKAKSIHDASILDNGIGCLLAQLPLTPIVKVTIKQGERKTRSIIAFPDM